ncbi:reverse transcriptase [Caerostris darwini]|uniref:Reverse transcriptase n=1 Tax=Caerostris darwini TaxID=1538125 RepID=A0AAV4W810_9ARAC|nr:reverse transcriptase [Caerostris darwini]
MLCPAALIPKLILQEAWKSKVSCYCPLPDDLQKEFSGRVKGTISLDEISIPRYLGMTATSESHVFVDACKTSYGGCAFVRTVIPPTVKVQLVKAKARVAPIKDMFIPKLELVSCCTGTRLAHSIRLAIDFSDMPITF